jgi:PCO_ADO
VIERRAFLLALLAHTLASRRLLAAGASRRFEEWIGTHEQLARELHRSFGSGARWQSEVERLSAEIELEEILRGIDFPKLERGFSGTKQPLRLGPGLAFGAAIFLIDRKNPITPHGHRNMASAHLLLDGKLRVRNFDRLADEPDHLILKPTVDATIQPGDCSTMSTQRNNIHWFTALTDRAFTLDVVVDALQPGDKPYHIDLVDPRGGTKRGDGTIRAPRIDWKTSVRLYG